MTGPELHHEVLIDACVNVPERNRPASEAKFQRSIPKSARGAVSSRPRLGPCPYRLVVIAQRGASGHDERRTRWVRVERDTHTGPAQISEALLRTPNFAGVPVLNRAFVPAQRALDDGRAVDVQR